MKNITLDEIMATGNSPRIHPNGFIQLDIDETTRLHVWPSVPLVETSKEPEIHDHVFNIRSEILVGGLTESLFEPERAPDGEYELFEVVPYALKGRADSPKPNSIQRYDLRQIDTRRFVAGESYELNSRAVHSTQPHGFTATLMRFEIDPQRRSARIFKHKGDKSPKFFDRNQVPEHRLWGYIKQALTHPHNRCSNSRSSEQTS